MKINGQLVMKLLGAHNQTEFVKTVFDPLKDPGDVDIYSNCRLLIKERSAVMKGQRASSSSTFSLWAERIKNKGIYKQLIDKIEIYYSNNIKMNNEFKRLFEEDRNNMPNGLAEKIKTKFNNHKESEAVLLLFLWSIYREEIPKLSFLYERNDDITPVSEKSIINSLSSNNYITPDNIITNVTDKAKNCIRLLNHTKLANSIFIGRDQLIDDMYSTLSNDQHIVILQGMGGIGKSETSLHYVEKYKDLYKTIIFAECNSNFIDLINDNTVFTLTKPFISERINQESDQDFFNRKISALRSAVNEETLIIFDNIDYYEPLIFNNLIGLCHIIITTRWQYKKYHPNSTLEVEEINDTKTCKEIISRYYGKNLHNDKYIDYIISFFSGIPLALELIAKQMLASNISSKEMYDLLCSHNEEALEEVFMLSNKNNVELSMYEHINRIFHIANLNGTEQYILSCLSLMPKTGISKKDVRDFCELENYNSLNSLVSRSWLQDHDGMITMHSLINETITDQCKPDLSSCQKFIDHLIDYHSAFNYYYGKFELKTKVYIIAKHLYTLFPEPIINNCDFYEWIEMILSHSYHAKEAIDLANNMLQLYKKAFGENHFRTARLLCRIGCNKHNCNNLNESYAYLIQGKAILIKLSSLTNEERLYISDVNQSITSNILERYSIESLQNNELANDLLNKGEQLCLEALDIRNSLKEYIGIEKTNCVAIYCHLGQIYSYKHKYDDAEKCLKLAEDELDTFGNDFFRYYISVARAILSIELENNEQAIKYLESALASRNCFFGENIEGFSAATYNLKSKLANLYKLTGDKKKAQMVYESLYDQINTLPYYKEEAEKISSLLENYKA